MGNGLTDIETNIFDKEELHTNCTVQILYNSTTGECSVGWWENPGWVSVEERLPEMHDEVLVYLSGYDEVLIAWLYLDGRWRSCTDEKLLNKITHWMPLPEPPQEYLEV